VESGVDAMILTPPLCDSAPLLNMMSKEDIPTLLVSTDHTVLGLSSIFIDERLAAREMTRHLIELGHERIGFIIGEPALAASKIRFDGFREALDDVGIAFDPTLVAQGLFTYRSGLEAAAQLLALERPPTAIFASNDDMAAATIMTAYRLGYDVPRELSVCGFDDSWIATSIYPELTTIRQPIREMAVQGITLLADLVQSYRSRKRPVKRQLLGYELVIRGSACKAGLDRDLATLPSGKITS